MAAARHIAILCRWLLVPAGCGGQRERAAGAPEIRETREVELAIPQVDYERTIYYTPGDPIFHLDPDKVDWDSVVEKNTGRW